jgi:hypothetical protein
MICPHELRKHHRMPPNSYAVACCLELVLANK